MGRKRCHSAFGERRPAADRLEGKEAAGACFLRLFRPVFRRTAPGVAPLCAVRSFPLRRKMHSCPPRDSRLDAEMPGSDSSSALFLTIGVLFRPSGPFCPHQIFPYFCLIDRENRRDAFFLFCRVGVNRVVPCLSRADVPCFVPPRLRGHFFSLRSFLFSCMSISIFRR